MSAALLTSASVSDGAPGAALPTTRPIAYGAALPTTVSAVKSPVALLAAPTVLVPAAAADRRPPRRRRLPAHG